MPRILSAGPGRPAASGREAVPWTVAAVLLTLTLRLPFVRGLPLPDEGGLMLVARHWHAGGPRLYGYLFLDRPPLLVLFWRLALALGGIEPARWLATGAVVLLVVAAAWAGYLVGGPRGARWSAFTTAALASTPLLETREANGELLGAPLVVLSCALALTAVRFRTKPVAQACCAFGAGLAGAGALLVKQNLGDGLVFAAVLVGVTGLRGTRLVGTTARVFAAGVVGALLPMAATVLWAVTRGPGAGVLWYTLYGFRVDAADVIANHGMAAPDYRLVRLGAISVLSGLAPLLLACLWPTRDRIRRKDPAALALLAMLAVEVAGVALGASFWPHYLIALFPSAALASAAPPALPAVARTWPRRGLSLVVTSSVVAVLVVASPLVRFADTTTAPGAASGPGRAAGSRTAAAPVPSAPTATRSGDAALISWLREADRPSDSAFVAYGHPNIIEASRLRPPRYPFLWSLPLRAEDPHLRSLTKAVSATSGPTWIVEWMRFDSWGIDPDGAFAAAVRRHYRLVGDVCGVPVYLRDGATRTIPRAPGSC